jgi:hypothetical protein
MLQVIPEQWQQCPSRTDYNEAVSTLRIDSKSSKIALLRRSMSRPYLSLELPESPDCIPNIHPLSTTSVVLSVQPRPVKRHWFTNL